MLTHLTLDLFECHAMQCSAMQKKEIQSMSNQHLLQQPYIAAVYELYLTDGC